jgi:nicotinate-nucleotide adenylyltransferase
MTELACAEDPRFCVSRIEQDSARNYSIDTVERLAAAGAKPWAFLIGADAFAEIESWRRWRDVVKLVDFIVVARPGSAYRVPEGARVHELPELNLPVSSSEVRRKLAAGEIDDALPASVADYITQRNLYREFRPND